MTIVFVNFVYSFCQFCAWIFLFFLHPIYAQSLWWLLQNLAYLYKQIMKRIHMDLYELKWQLLMKEGGIHCNIECKSLKKWSCLFSCIWVKLGCIIRPVNAKKLIKSKVWLYIILEIKPCGLGSRIRGVCSPKIGLIWGWGLIFLALKPSLQCH